MNVLVVYCHPDAASFTAAIRDAAVEALRSAGHVVQVRDLHGSGFDPVFSADERRTHKTEGASAEVGEYVAELRWCEHLVLVYPTWWSGQPAMLKGWVDRVWVRGVAWELPVGSNRVQARLKNVRRITAVTTHGSPKWINALEGEAGKRTMTRSLRAMCHPLTRTKWIAMYGVDTSTPRDREAFIDAVSAKLR